MKVFMSWSGEHSKAVAELIHEWIGCVLQAVEPWMSTEGLDHGGIWFTDIIKELGDTSTGIICLTQENKAAPWILFEAGLLLKGLTKNKVCVFLVDLKTTDVGQPLSNFNHTPPNKEGVQKLIATLNKDLPKPLDAAHLNKMFEKFWPDFESKLAEILQRTPHTAKVEAREERALLEEILQNTRNLEKQMRGPEPRKLSMADFLVSTTDASPVSEHLRAQAASILLRNEIAKGIPMDEYFDHAYAMQIGERAARKIWQDAHPKSAAEIFGGGSPELPPGARATP